MTSSYRSNPTRAAGRLAVVLLLAGISPGCLAAQQEACSGPIRGDLGIAGTGCRGNSCVITRVPDGRDPDGRQLFTWVYTVEPEVQAVRPGSPVDGAIREGDYLIAVDGVPITTLEGSRRLQRVEPGDRVTVSYRREGRLGEVEVRAVTRCDEETDDWAQLGARLSTIGERVARLGDRTAASVEGDDEPDPVDAPIGPVVDNPAVGRPTTSPRPGVHLGITFQCSRCVIYTTDDAVRWEFSQPPTILRVEPGGPADRAGLRAGDRLRGVDGYDVESEEGGRAFGDLRPGTPVRLALVRRDGSLATVTVVPEAGSDVRGGADGTDVSSARVDQASLQFLGTVGGTLVEVRGSPVEVDDDATNGTITIRTGSNVIQVRTSGRP